MIRVSTNLVRMMLAVFGHGLLSDFCVLGLDLHFGASAWASGHADDANP